MKPKRVFLFLQGPPGPLFRLLANAMRDAGVDVHRINLNAGDRHDWGAGGINFRSQRSVWAEYLDHFVQAHEITDILLFGDRRPYHRIAHGIAKMRGIAVHVLEEGYIRPHWMTLEPDGVNGSSTLPRTIDWYITKAPDCPPEGPLPPITASFRRRASDSYWYYHHVLFGALRFPHFRNHRATPIATEALGWIKKYACKPFAKRDANQALSTVAGRKMFIFPLQLSGDYQIRDHSPFPDMQSATRYVIDSFAQHAPEDVLLLIKVHPLDCSLRSWRGFVNRAATQAGVADRVIFIDGGDLEALTAAALGMVCVNSTSATLALQQDVAVCPLGDAIYDIPGLTYQGHIDQFWIAPEPPQPGAYRAFVQVLTNKVLVRGGLASQSAVRTLIRSILVRFEIIAAYDALPPSPATSQRPVNATALATKPRPD